MAKLTDKEIQEFLDDLNKSPGGVKSTEPAFERYRKHFLRNVDFDEIKKYSPEQLIRGARTSEELILIGEHLHKEWGGNHWWWQEYHERRVHLSHLPSLYDVTTDTATGKQRGMWGVPVNPEVYVKSSQSGAQKFAVNRRLFSRFGSWEQITGQQDLFSLVDTPNGPVLRDWKPIPAPKLPSNRPINALIFDIESTGLIGKENSSIISLGLFDTKTKSFGGSAYASFDRNIKYDDVIEKTIIPQWQKSISKPGVQLVSERQLVEGFIEKIEKTSKTHALMGYNIKQFDLGKVLESAKKYGLQSRFKSAIQQATIIDVADYAKAFVSQQLGGQIVGWESSQLGINPLGWQLEAVAESLGIVAKEAHAAEADVDMTRAIWEKLRDPSKWDEVARKDFKADVLINAVARNQGRTPLRVSKGINRVNFAREMMGAEAKYIRPLAEHLAEEFPSVTQGATSKATAKIAKGTKRFGIGNIASYGASFVGLNMMMPGNFWQNAFTSVTWEAARVGAQKAGVKGWKTWAAAAGGSLIGNAIWFGAGSLIDGPSDVAVSNTKFSGKKRPQDLISRDNNTGGLPTSLMGIPISPEILSFRRDVIEDKGELAELEADIKRKQAAAQAQLGDFAPSELKPISAPVEGLAGNKNLREVNLSDYKLTVEDADTLILSKKGLAGLLSKDILIRLSGVDAPEVAGHADDPMEAVRIWQEQAGGKWATEQYKKLVEEQSDLRLVIDTKNKTYGRSLGVLVGDEGQNLALESVRRGLVAALPFGKSSEDVVSRKAIAQAEAEAKASEAGIWQFARYKAIAEASEEIGQPITFNVLTEKTKLAQNLNLGAYASFLESLGEQQRELTPQEVRTARRVGRTLRKTHGSARFSQKFSGKDDAHNTIEALRHDGGLSEQIRRENTAFGSGFDAVRSYLQFEGINEGKRRFLSTKEKRYTVDKASKFSDRGTVYNTLEGLSQKGLVGDVRTAFSGRDDEYNTIEGLRHDGGLSQKLRVLLTDFGSGWDPIRALAKKLFKESKDPMSELRKSPKFKEALSSAVEKNVLGEGWFGKATLMESTFMGEKFQFVRKTGEIGKQEVSAMKAAEHTVAPSVYSSAEGVIEMELFKGSPLQSLAPEKARELEPQVAEAFKKLHGAGYEHADPHLGNIFLAQTDQGEKIGLIDLGNAKLLSEYNDKQAALRAAQGDIDISSKFIRSLGEESQFAAVDPFAAAENISAGNVLSQLENAPAQSYVDPFAKAASQGDIRQNASRIFESSVKSDQMLSKQLKLEISRTSSVPKKLGSRASIGEEVPKGISSRTISQPMTISSSGPGMGRTEEVAREVTSDAQLSLNFNAPSLGVAQPPRLGSKPNVSQSVVGSQSSTNLPKPDFGPGGDPYRVKRMQRFRKVSRDAVGIGHRSAHNAGRGHSSFKTVV